MNYYERHLGDYARDTAHLSIMEHGAYTLLLDRYYSSEHGIPADQAHRLARARTREEKQAVDTVLDEFFMLVDGIWINDRCEEELAKAKTKIEASRANGKKGGRPKKETLGSENETQEKPTGFSLGSENETQTKAHQTPDTKHHIKTPKPPAGVDARFEAFWSAYPKKVGPDAGRKAFLKRKPDDALLAEMLAAIAAQKKSEQWQSDGGKYIPNPATWLNQGRWQDELTPATVNDDEADRPQWALDAGFPNRYEAENAMCWQHNAHQFRDGKRIGEVAA